ncbi:DUF3040 domain-containing protein [Saccharothrix sp. HUAS TT1]|uniref:DUF3040 domain-containing protein n=1 Tax=unclassified Saccharothrix TaxID=2593673 RepID=UPI00345BB2A6
MGLREHEQRALAQIQQQLADDDPRFAARLTRGRAVLRVPRRVLLGAVLVGTYVLGLLGIVVGTALSSPLLIALGAVVTAALPVRVAARAWRERRP